MVAPEIQTHDGRSQKFPIKSAGHAKAWRIGSARTKAAMTKPEQQDTETEVYVSLRQLKKFRGRSPNDAKSETMHPGVE